MISTSVPFQWYEETKEWVGLELRSFTYKNDSYDAKLVSEFVKDDFIVIENGYFQVGCLLNDAV